MGSGPGSHVGMRPAGQEKGKLATPEAGTSSPWSGAPSGTPFPLSAGGRLRGPAVGSSAWPCLSVCCSCLRGQEPSSETGAAQPGPGPASSSSQRVTLPPPWGLGPGTTGHFRPWPPVSPPRPGGPADRKGLGLGTCGPGSGGARGRRHRVRGPSSTLPALGSDPAWHMKTPGRRAGTPHRCGRLSSAQMLQCACESGCVCACMYGCVCA